MPVIDLYSRRKQDSTQVGSDDLIYDHVPKTVRVQIMYIWNSAIGSYVPSPNHSSPTKRNNNEAWRTLHEAVCREKGLLQLSRHPCNPKEDCIAYLLNEPNVDNVLDIVELAFRLIHGLKNIRRYVPQNVGLILEPDDAISELNARFKQASLGYQFESGHIVKTDNLAMHETTVKPALSLLIGDSQFSGAENEFMAALKHYRAGDNRDAITAANSAFESVLKTICEISYWQYDQGDSAGRLLKIVRREGLFPDYMGKPFEQLIATLQSGLTPIRNRESSSHGQGSEVKSPPEHVTEYALNLCATQIMFLIKSMHATMK